MARKKSPFAGWPFTRAGTDGLPGWIIDDYARGPVQERLWRVGYRALGFGWGATMAAAWYGNPTAQAWMGAAYAAGLGGIALLGFDLRRHVRIVVTPATLHLRGETYDLAESVTVVVEPHPEGQNEQLREEEARMLAQIQGKRVLCKTWRIYRNTGRVSLVYNGQQLDICDIYPLRKAQKFQERLKAVIAFLYNAANITPEGWREKLKIYDPAAQGTMVRKARRQAFMDRLRARWRRGGDAAGQETSPGADGW